VSATFQKVLVLVKRGEARISEHGYDELAADNLTAREVVSGIGGAIVVEDYPTFHKGPCVLVRQQDRAGQPIHVVWGVPVGQTTPAVLVTAYRPDPARWTADCLRRKS
jgi:hypothetical protein